MPGARRQPGPLRIGLTGGIASGKSLVAEQFAALGIPIIDTDEIARAVVAPGEAALAEIRAQFGDKVFDATGRLDRRALRRRVFANAADRQALERILHPRIRARTLAAIAAAEGPYLIVVVPLLVESGFERLVDRVLVVDCPEAIQLERLRHRDRESAEGARQILAAQASREARLAVADDVIDNSGPVADTQAQVAALHRRYLELAGAAG